MSETKWKNLEGLERWHAMLREKPSELDLTGESFADDPQEPNDYFDLAREMARAQASAYCHGLELQAPGYTEEY